MNLDLIEPDGTSTSFTTGFTDHGNGLYSFVVPIAQTDQEGTHGVVWYPDAAQFVITGGQYVVVPRILGNLSIQYISAGGGNFNLDGCFNLTQWKSRTIIAAPLSDADLTALELAVTDSASATILSISKGDSEFTAGSSKAADRVFFSKLITAQTSSPWMIKLAGTYAGVTFDLDFPAASWF